LNEDFYPADALVLEDGSCWLPIDRVPEPLRNNREIVQEILLKVREVWSNHMIGSCPPVRADRSAAPGQAEGSCRERGGTCS
jgi:hypothetical protein